MRFVFSKQYEDILDSQVIEVIEKFQVTEKRKGTKKRARSAPRNFVQVTPPPFLLLNSDSYNFCR